MVRSMGHISATWSCWQGLVGPNGTQIMKVMDVDDMKHFLAPFLHFAYLNVKLHVVDWACVLEFACSHAIQLKNTCNYSINNVHGVSL
jgi:hypothetical protein